MLAQREHIEIAIETHAQGFELASGAGADAPSGSPEGGADNARPREQRVSEYCELNSALTVTF